MPNAVTEAAPSTQEQRALAKLCNLQLRMLPQAPPPVPGYRLVLRYRPALLVTGDYHDFFVRSDGLVAVFVGDGAGHGPAASVLMAIMRTILHTHPDVHGDPGDTLSAAGRMFQGQIPNDLFMTGVYLTLGPCGRVRWASGGHHPPVRVVSSGQVAAIDMDPVGQVLGLGPEEYYSTVDWQLMPAERLVLFTDGIWEGCSRDGDQFGRKRLFACLSDSIGKPLDVAVAELVDRVQSHLEGAAFEDDFTVVAVEREL